MKAINVSIIIIFVFHLACKKPAVNKDASLISDGIETLNRWKNFDEALFLYKMYLSKIQDMQGYLGYSNALLLFSNTGQKKKYFEYLQKYIAYHVDKSIVKCCTNEELYNQFKDEIEVYFKNKSKDYISEIDSLIFVEYLIKDQEIRINGTLTREKDSLIQIPLKSIISQNKYNNKYL